MVGGEELGPILQLVSLSSHCGAALLPWGHLLPGRLSSPISKPALRAVSHLY